MKPFTAIAAILFALMAVVHLLGLIVGWEVIIASLAVPVWISVPVLVVFAGLALMLWREGRT
jgi:hypothetical protein